MKSALYSTPEPLEQRIAPASLVYTSALDANDKVTITVSKGSATDLMNAITANSVILDAMTKTYVGEDFSFALNLATNPIFKNANVTVTSTGHADATLTSLDATGFDLGTVSIQGELNQILAGDNVLKTPAVRILSATSLGTSDHGVSVLQGSLLSLSVAGDIGGTLLLTSSSGSIGTAVIGGKLQGSTSDSSGLISATGGIGKITVTGGLIGGAGDRSGSINAVGNIGTAILGSIVGGSGEKSGNLFTFSSISNFTVNGSITGSEDANSDRMNGQIFATRLIGTGTVTGQLVGGAADNSGNIAAGLGILNLSVSGGIHGGVGPQSGSIGSGGLVALVTLGTAGGTTDIMVGGDGPQSGSVLSSTSIRTVVVNGNILGGVGANSADIASAGVIGKVTVHGSVTGGEGDGSGSIGSTQVLGTVVVDGTLKGVGPHSGQIVSTSSIQSVTVGGDVLGGSGVESGSIGSLGTIKAIHVVGSLTGSLGQNSGTILGGGTINAIQIDGSLVGFGNRLALPVDGSQGVAPLAPIGGNDGRIEANILGTVKIGQDIHGGTTTYSGSIRANTIGTITAGSITGGTGDLSGTIFSTGTLNSVTVSEDVAGGSGDSSGTIGAGSTIQSVVIHGSLVGGDGDQSGTIFTSSGQVFRAAVRSAAGSPAPSVNHDIHSVQIDVNIEGGDGYSSGAVVAGDNLHFVTIGTNLSSDPDRPTGRVIGGSGENFSGSIQAFGSIGTAFVYGNLEGGSGDNSGTIYAFFGNVDSTTVKGNVIGSTGERSGAIQGDGVGTVAIYGDLVGGGHFAGSVISFRTDIQSVTVFGTIRSTVAEAGGGSASIVAYRDLVKLNARSIQGMSDASVIIAAGGNQASNASLKELALGTMTVTNRMAYTDVMIGYAGIFGSDGFELDAVNGHVAAGTITVGTASSGTNTSPVWTANDVVVGATGAFSGADLINGGSSAIVSNIARITINGVIGQDTVSSSNPSHTIVSKLISSIIVNNTAVPLTAGAGNDDHLFPNPADPFSTTLIYEVMAGS